MAAQTQLAPTTVQSVGTGGAGPSDAGSSAKAKRARPKAAAAPAQSGTRIGNWSELSVPIAVLGIILAMIAPLPAFVLDFLISANITMSVVVLLVSMYIRRPVEFSVFPTSLLLLTLFR